MDLRAAGSTRDDAWSLFHSFVVSQMSLRSTFQFANTIFSAEPTSPSFS